MQVFVTQGISSALPQAADGHMPRWPPTTSWLGRHQAPSWLHYQTPVQGALLDLIQIASPC